MVQVSFRLLLSVSVFLFVVAFTGFIVLFLTWTSAMSTIEPTRDKLRDAVISKVTIQILGVTGGVQHLSMEGAKGVVGRSMFGCCSATSDYAQSVEKFPEVIWRTTPICGCCHTLEPWQERLCSTSGRATWMISMAPRPARAEGTCSGPCQTRPLSTVTISGIATLGNLGNTYWPSRALAVLPRSNYSGIQSCSGYL